MSIEQVNNAGAPIDPIKPRRSRDQQQPNASDGDRVELSDQAQSLFEGVQSMKMEEIQQRIISGFYFQRGVSEKIADALLKDLRKIAAR